MKLVGTCVHCALAATALATLHLVADQTVTAAIRLSASCLKLAMDLFSLGKLIKDLSECKEEKEKSKIKDNIKQKVFDTVNSVINLTINTARFAPQSYPVTMTLIACSMLLTGVKLYWKHVLTDKTKEKIKDKTGSVLNKLRSAQSNIKARLLKVREQESSQGKEHEPVELVPSSLTAMEQG